MSVAHDASSKTATISQSEAAFSFTHTPVGVPRSALVVVFEYQTNVDDVLGVTYGGVALGAVAGGRALDTLTELGTCKAYHLGAGIPTAAQLVEVARNNNATTMGAMCATATADGDTEVTGVVLLQENQILAEQNVDDGRAAGASLRYAGLYTGFSLTGSTSPGVNTTALEALGLIGSAFAKLGVETVPGFGSRPVGFTSATADDVAEVLLAIREAAVVAAASGDLPFISQIGAQRF